MAPIEQRVDEWSKIDAAGRHYHLRQWQEVKRSTVHFSDFIAPVLKGSGPMKVMDMGCGAGSSTYYLASRNRNVDFIGIDISAELIQIAGELSAAQQTANLSFAADDWFDLGPHEAVRGVISLQTLSWLPEFEEPLRQLFEKVSPDWIALSSLFYEGDISCKIEVHEHAIDKKCFYNVYALPAVDRFAQQHGYWLSAFKAFEIDMDIAEPDSKDVMGTYTLQVGLRGRRLQLSGPLLMNWYFVMLQRRPA